MRVLELFAFGELSISRLLPADRSSTASPPTCEHAVTYQKPWIDSSAFCDSYSSTLERLAIRKFGGEPGENEFGLIDKMQEMFDSMNWVI